MSRGLRRFDRIAPARSAPRRATIFWALGQAGDLGGARCFSPPRRRIISVAISWRSMAHGSGA